METFLEVNPTKTVSSSLLMMGITCVGSKIEELLRAFPGTAQLLLF